MQPVLIGAGAGGLVLGFIIGFLIAKGPARRAAAEAEAKIKETQQKLDSAKKEAAAHLEKEHARAVEAEKTAAGLKERLEKSVETNKDKTKELQQLQSSLKELEAQSAKANAAAEAQANARQQADGRVKQAEGAVAQAQQVARQAQAEMQTLQAQLEELKESAERRNREVQKLRGEVAGLKKGGASGLDESVEAFTAADGSLDGILGTLMDQEGQRAAVLADANGIIVAAVGEAGLKEGMAATAQLVGSICTQLVDMVPFSSIRSYVLQDTQSNVLAGRAFLCQGETVGLVTYGQRTPADRVLDGAMASLSAALE